VLTAIYFDDESFLETAKVDDVRIERDLPSEFHIGEPPIAQSIPEHALSPSHVTAKKLGARDAHENSRNARPLKHRSMAEF
jgi:hypothetical protein